MKKHSKSAGSQADFSHPLNRGLEAWWLFSEAGGKGVRDLSPNGHHLTETNTSSVVSKWISGAGGGYAYYTPGDIDSSLQCIAKKTVTGTYTVAGWVFLSALTGTTHTFFSTRDTYNLIDIKIADTGGGLLHGDIGGSTGGWIDTGVDAAIPGGATLNKWHHVAYVVSASGADIYWDGSLIGTKSFGLNSNPPDLMVKGYQVNLAGSGSLGEPYTTGAVDDFRLFSRLLSAGEVRQLYTEPYVGLLQPSTARIYIAAAGGAANWLKQGYWWNQSYGTMPR